MRSAAYAGDWPLTQDYGPTDLAVEPRYEGGHWHCGVDIGCPTGTPLFAVRAGKVTHRTSGILGITTAAGRVDYYVHGNYTVFLGATVHATAALGYSGAVIPGGGSLTGPHLHFEVQPIGVQINTPPAIDPRPLLWPQTYGPGSGTVTDDMSAKAEEQIDKLYSFFSNPLYGTFESAFAALLKGQADSTAAIVKALAALPAVSGGAVNLQPLTDAITAQTAAVAALEPELAYIRQIVDKIDRGD